MGKVARIIIYEGSDDWLVEQLGGSLPDGTKDCWDGKISVLTIGSSQMIESFIGSELIKKQIQE